VHILFEKQQFSNFLLLLILVVSGSQQWFIYGDQSVKYLEDYCSSIEETGVLLRDRLTKVNTKQRILEKECLAQ